jgi:hypothetical protein
MQQETSTPSTTEIMAFQLNVEKVSYHDPTPSTTLINLHNPPTSLI